MEQVLTQTDALVELTLLSQEVTEEERDNFFIKVLNSDLPMEVVTRLTTLWDVTKEVGGRIIYLGRIIVVEIMKFIAKFPHLTVGMAIGAAIHTLLAATPFVGPILAPLVAVISAAIGFRLDTGKPISDNLEGVVVDTFTDIIAMAKTFLQWFIDVLRMAIANASS